MTKAQFDKEFHNAIGAHMDQQDVVAIRTEWCNTLDAYAREGMVTEHQAQTWVYPDKYTTASEKAEKRKRNRAIGAPLQSQRVLHTLPQVITHRGVNYYLLVGEDVEKAIKACEATGTKYGTRLVLSKNLRGRTDLHGRPYKPSKWIYTPNQDRDKREADKKQSLEYYRDEMNKINAHAMYSPTFSFRDESNKTNTISLNHDSATVLIEWLKHNFNL